MKYQYENLVVVLPLLAKLRIFDDIPIIHLIYEHGSKKTNQKTSTEF